MNDQSAVAAYQQSTARGASPVGLVVSLYDTILRDFRRALAALDSNNVELRVFELNHALTVIAHLQSVLDHQRGGEAASRLDRFYQITHAMILAASVSGSRDSLLKLIDLYGSMRQAWHQADQQLSASASGGPVPLSQIPPAPQRSQNPAPQPRQPEVPSSPSTRGRWSA